MKPRALVIRSGAISFSAGRELLRVELVEKTSHSIQPYVSGEDVLDRPATLAVFTSQVAVQRLFEETWLLSHFRGALAGGKVAAVGQATAEALRKIGIEPDIVAGGSAQSVLDRIPGNLEGWRVILPRGRDASEELGERLAARGAEVAPLVLYRKVPNPADYELETEILAGSFAAFCPTSPSAARWLFTGIGDAAMQRLQKTPAAVLGPFTRRYLKAHGIERVEVAREASFPAAAALLESLAAEASQA